jgi:methylenetetrahydrofolate dehydrogenase (NADP+)/methenyltetrahydrofolate cyclohydrolase
MKFKSSVVVMDVGINIDEDGSIHGDCEPDLPVLFQSTVPGGVELLTRLALFFNLQTLIDRKGKRRE